MVKIPAYLRIAALLRSEIETGRFGPGAKLPSESQLMMRHQVSRSVAKWAVSVLKADGLVDARQGAGVFVRWSRRIVRDARRELLSTSDPTDATPMDGDNWHGALSATVAADAAIAQRLEIPPGTPVRQIVSRRCVDGSPRHLVTLWQLAQPAGARQRWQTDEVCERIVFRPAKPAEIASLHMPARGSVVAIARTAFSQGIPVEAADIVAPSDRYELVYRFPIP